MARQKIKLAHERQVLRLRAAKMQARIAVEDHKDRIRRINAELEALKPPKAPTT